MLVLTSFQPAPDKRGGLAGTPTSQPTSLKATKVKARLRKDTVSRALEIFTKISVHCKDF